MDKIARRSAEGLLQPRPPNQALAVRGISLRLGCVDSFKLYPDRHATRPLGGWRWRDIRLLHRLVSVLANDWTSERSHLRSSMASAVQSPVLKFPLSGPRGAPGL